MALELERFAVVDVSTWTSLAGEPGGKRSKVWLRDSDGREWLRKAALEKPSRPSEPAVEVTALRLARAAGLPAPESHGCTWMEEGTLRYGSIVESFVAGGLKLQEGHELLGGFHVGYDPESKSSHSLRLVKPALKCHERRTKSTLRPAFMDMLIFDGWIGNGDRHPSNWGILQAPDGKVRLAPVYDVAACLGSELTDDHPLLDSRGRTDARLRDYVAACPSGFGDGEKLISLAQVLAIVRKWDGWQERASQLLAIFEELWDGPLWRYFEEVPLGWLSSQRRMLAKELLGHRLAWLRAQI